MQTIATFELDGRRVELVEVAPVRYGATLDGVRVPLCVRHRTHGTEVLSGADDHGESSAKGLEVRVRSAHSRDAGLLAHVVTGVSTRTGSAITFEHPHAGLGPSSAPSLAVTMTVRLRGETVELDLFQDRRDDSAY